MSIPTPYYRTLAPTHSLGCDDQPDFMYGPYDIFCMETRLYPTVYKLYDRDIELIFKRVHKNNRMEINIDLVEITDTSIEPTPNKKIHISDENRKILETAVDKIVTENVDYCLIDKNELYLSLPNRNYPQSWLNTILGYIPIPTEYNPFVKQEGIYLSFNPGSDYKTAYNEVVKSILDTMDTYYQNGVVYKAGNIAERWKLERLDYEEVKSRLYQPMWSDKRFAPFPVDFLLERIRGDPYIRIKVSDNLVRRHYISKILHEKEITNFIFEVSYIKIPVDNIDDAQYVTALVVSGQDGSVGKVVIYATNRLSWVYLFIEAAKEILDNPDCTEYRISSVERPYIFSCMVDRNTPSDTFLELLRETALKRLNDIKHGKKDETSLHDIVTYQKQQNNQNN